MINVTAVLEHLYRDIAWTVFEEDPDRIIWPNDAGNKPSRALIEATWEEIKFDVLMRPVRVRRNALLAASDWTQMPDAPVDQAVWAEYRQALRDLPKNTVDPENPVWPTPPA